MKTNSYGLLRGCSAAVLAASLASMLPAQTDPTPTPTAAAAAESGLSHSDRSFIKKAAKAGMKEITVSQAVVDHLSNAQAKAFAQQMVTDHTAANNALMALAQQKGVEIPAKDESSLTEDWSKKTGDVDRAYVKEMVSDHEEAVKLFEKATQSSDPDVAAFAQKTLPTLQHHLSMAVDLKNAIN